MSIKNKLSFGKQFILKGTLTAFSTVLLSVTAVQAEGQSEIFVDYSHPNITIDLSVIGDGGYQAATGNTAAPAYGFGMPDGPLLKMPGSQPPRSMLHVPKADGKSMPSMSKSNSQPVVKAPAPVKKSATASVNKVPSSPTKSVAPPPTPKPVPAPEIAKAPVPKAPPAMPAKPVEVATPLAKPAAPAMPTQTAKAETKAPPPAPVVKPAPKVTEKAAPAAPTTPPTPKAAQEPSKEQASLPPSDTAGEANKGLRVTFAADQTKLPEQAKAQLTDLANSMKGNDEMRLQLMAYAGGPSLSSSLARRMSLSRALSIRSFLIENGVRSTRIDVRALGNKTDEEPVNRVDLNVAGR